MNREAIEKFVMELRDFQKDLERKQLSMFKKLVEHLEYHTKNEAKWGLVKIIRDHPFRAIFAGFSVGMTLAVYFAPTLQQWLHLLIKLIR